MKRTAEIIVFGLLAIGLHMFLMGQSSDQGADAGGSGGAALVTVKAANHQIETMVADWTRPPPVQQQIDIEQPDIDTPTEHAPVDSVRIDTAPNAAFKLAAMPSPDQESPKQPLSLQPAPVRPPEPVQDPTLAPAPQVAQPTPKPQIRPQQNPRQVVAPPSPTTDMQADQLPDPVKAPPPPPKVQAKPDPKPQPKPKQQPKPKKQAQRAEQNQRASAGGSAQIAAGTGGSATAGSSRSSDVKTLSKGKEASLIKAWGARIRAQVERRKRSPAGKGGKQTILLSVTIDSSGALLGVSVAKSSGDAKLDAAAMATVRRAGRFPRAPKQVTKKPYRFKIPLTYF